MANALITPTQVVREALRLFKNSNAFLSQIDKTYSNQFARDGAKVGYTINVRRPNDYVVSNGPTLVTQDTIEQTIPITLNTQKHIGVSFSMADRTMALDDFSTRILAPQINNLAGAVAGDIMSGVEGGAANLIRNVDGSNNTISPTAATWASAYGQLTKLSAPANRKIILDPLTQARTVATLSGLFNSQAQLARQYSTGVIRQNVLGFDWMDDPTVLVHQTGSLSAATVNGAGQTGQTIVTSATTGTLNKGDIITVAGVNAINRVTKQDTGQLAQFVVTANVASGATSIPVFPAITPGNVAFGTVTASPANGAAVALVNKASEQIRKNIAFVPEAVTFVSADLVMPTGSADEASRQNLDGVSMRFIRQYQIGTDQSPTRLDILYGYAWLRPEWVVVVADAL